MTRGMLLYSKRSNLSFGDRAARFRRGLKVPFSVKFSEAHGSVFDICHL